MEMHVEIVNYHPDYAESIAEMWSRSQDAWGGGTSVRTGEQIRQEEENSDSLAVFLAVCDGQVVGYCSLSEYREDTGALYIQLLNVRPDYHGKKIGKMLVLRAVKETMDRGWPRLDLYTWEGNVKAVPLYKRCGFFWEDREDTTHFMNFIPQIVNCPALAPYFSDIDWYADFTRTIEVAPDGRVENNFHTYTYAWTKNGRELRVDVERRGRGIRLIETEDYILSATVEQAEPVFGKEYIVQYRVINKSGNPLKLDFQGVSDRNIVFDWRESVEVEGEQLLTARFFVGEIEEEQSEWQTCPTVRAHVAINGLQAVLKVGIVPKFPANLSMRVPDTMYALQGPYEFYLDVENNFLETASFSFELPSVPWLELEVREFTVQLGVKERASLAIPYRLLDYGFYRSQLQIQAILASGREITFSRIIGGGFSGPGAMCVGETGNTRVVMNGKHSLHYDKEDNQIYIRRSGRKEQCILMHPQIGKPYSGEFSKKKPEQWEWKQEGGAVGFKHTYRSGEYPQLLLHMHSLLYADGTVKLWQEVENDSGTNIPSKMWVSQRIYYDLYRSVLPYGGQFVEINDSHGNDYDYWDGGKVNEPWIFSRGEKEAFGICWSDTHSINLNDWNMELETHIGRVDAGETKRTGVIILSFGGFEDWKSFRNFALKRSIGEHPEQPVCHIELTANGGNPFVSPETGSIPIMLRDIKQNVWEGEVSVSYVGNFEPAETVTFSGNKEAKAYFMLPSPDRPIETIRVNACIGPLDETYHTSLFQVGSNSVKQRKNVESGFTVHEVDNGRIRIAAAAGYYPGLHSFTVDGREWLATGFPKYGPKSWWNPWIGGISDLLEGLGPLSVLKEECSASFVHLPDEKNNMWSGIKVSLNIQKHETYKGLTLNGYYLLLPGVPILAYFTEIRQETGMYLDGKQLMTEMFLHPGNGPDHGWLRTFNLEGEQLCYRLGNGELQVRETGGYTFGREEQKGIMHVVTDESVIQPSVYSNKEVSCLSFSHHLWLPNGTLNTLAPIFFVFTDDILPQGALKELRGLTFKNTKSLHTKKIIFS
ncbi:GNAT family N-acetyltransferase [Aneurinibacillus migulanus]|uniref:Predicted N-acetyltransferase YhbS n=1 Tax=Aneurinibacillus migulanus TaxID=47500 RepID=A0A0M0H599_ANEMI|nr:GNAT family N-acetyltransferase [Aneurinibacillus migulanus]KON96896.1 hypothetical protein AF333_16820 [Aneurinibacillus migulanus]MED0894256.1 GNAT family N-acetyltransferase [Aneurinibacillus migulanus]MED1619529.1 GNAT family N-acetyltransferase [Aneurinibacillus migulanus]SDJ69506.1 Predicted N-acetyltransferase YhbS [Aneurinibacillus migulanus]GED17684.1 hypothetical protein AMI01nite_56750 [Aneurinibacillus migulanus]